MKMNPIGNRPLRPGGVHLTPWRSLLRFLGTLVPFPAMTVPVLALFLIKEEFPFSNFPMYSNISEEAEVTFVTDQNDKPLAMKPLFKTSSATSKKMYLKELGTIAQKRYRDSASATPEERAQAGKAVLDSLVARLILNDVPPGTTALRFHVRTFKAGVAVADCPSKQLAEYILPAS